MRTPASLKSAQPLPDWSDQELVLALSQTGAEDAMEAIIARHAPMVLSVCRRVLENLHDAEDAAQATFLALVKKAGQLSARRIALAPWLCRAARLAALASRRQRLVRHSHENEAARTKNVMDHPMPRSSEEILTLYLDEGIDGLPTKLREAVVLRYVRGLSQEETAAELGCSVSAAAMRASRGLERLRRYLAKVGFGGSAFALAALIQASSAQALPAGFAAATFAVCSGKTAATAASIQLAAAVTRGLAWLKLKALAMPLAAGLAVTLLVGLTAVTAHKLNFANPPAEAPPKPDVELARLDPPPGPRARASLPPPPSAPTPPHAAPAPLVDPQPPAEDYWAARIVLERAPSGFPPRDLYLDGAFSEGRMPVIGRHDHREVIGHVLLDGDRVCGTFPVRPQGERACNLQVSVDGRVIDGLIEGVYTAEVRPMFGADAPGHTVEGKLSGFVRGAGALRKLQSFAPGAAWPCWSGPTTGMAATQTDAPLVRNLADAQLLWRSQETLPHGPAVGIAERSLVRAAVTRGSGGGASPVFADGRVYVVYFESCGGEYDEKLFASMLAQYQSAAEDRGWQRDAVTARLREKASLRADEVVLCIDAATGKTLWKTVFPAAGVNRQQWRFGPINGTPVVGGGRVFAMSSGGKLHALDTADGRPLWSVQVARADGPATNDFNAAPNLIGGMVVVSNQDLDLCGLDPATGREIWRFRRGSTATTPIVNRWVHEGREYAVALGCSNRAPDRIRLIDPASGSLLWEQTVQGCSKGLTVCGDWLLALEGVNLQPERNMPVSSATPCCVAYRLSLQRPHWIWTTPCPYVAHDVLPVASDGRVLLSGRRESQLLELSTGKLLATWQGHGAGNEGNVVHVADRFILHHDGVHGEQRMTMLPDSPEGFTALGAVDYALPHPHTSSNHQRPMTQAWVDGRVFIRGADGIYCYDLRAARAAD